MARMMRAHDWSGSPLGHPQTWPQALRTCVRLMLNTRHPLFLFWGPDAICIYNDAYRAILGRERHAIALGNAGAVVWEEIWEVLGPQVEQVLSGGEATWHESHLIPLTRDGKLEDSYWTYSYSPVDDEQADNGVGGVLVIVTETTETVLAERKARSEGRRFAQLFEQAPTFMAVLRGPQHIFEFCNPGYNQLVGHRDIIGKSVAEAIPEAADQGYLELLDSVFESGVPFSTQGKRIRLQLSADGAFEERYLDFVYQPILEDDGEVTGIFVEGVDVTQRHAAEVRNQVLAQITDEMRSTDQPGDLAQAVARILGEALGVTRVGFGSIDLATQTYTAQPGWTAEGFEVPPSQMNMGAFSAYLERLGRGDIIRVNDVTKDDLTKSHVQTLRERHAGAFVNVPVIDRDGLVALMYVSHHSPREWTDNDIGLILEVADRTQAYVARIRSSQRLAESEAQFRTFAQAVPNHVWAATPDGRLYWFNERTYAYSGATPGSLDGSAWAGIVHPDDIEEAAHNWEASLEAGDVYEAEFRIRRADGAYRWHLIRALPIYGSEQDIVGWIGTNTDIEDQRQAIDAFGRLNATLEEEVAERTAERDQMWRNSQAILVVIDENGRFEAVSPSVREILGFVEDEVEGQPLSRFVHEDDKVSTQRAFTDAMAGARMAVHNRCRHKDGTIKWLSWLGSWHGDRLFASARDVSAEREASEALAQVEQALRQSQKMEAVGQLTGGIAHDFNNMLAVVSGSLELLDRRLGDQDPRAKHYVQAASESARRAANLTQRLLAFSRQQPLQPQVLDPNKLVSGMSDLLRHSIGAEIRLETVLCGGAWRVEVDPNQLENVILNLAVNSRDAMPGGGKLTIETQNSHLDARYVSAEPGITPGQYVMIALTDTGAGMTDAVIARAFDPFFTTKPVGKGTGLGLSQVYGFVKQSGGHVKIYSEPGHGTTIKLYLPRAGEPETVTAPTDQTLAAIAGDARELILVVDDEPAVRRFSTDALHELGYRVIEADSADTALQALEAHPAICLLFTDIIMPDTNGKALADEAQVLRPDLKILFTTGYTRNAVVHNGVVDKGVNLISKPFSINELAASVREILDRR